MVNKKSFYKKKGNMEVAQMKNKFTLIIFFLLLFETSLHAEYFGIIKAEKVGSEVVFRLPYKRTKGRNKYFNEEVETALVVDNIMVDGTPLLPGYDDALYLCLTDEYKTERIPSSEEFVYIRMSWRKKRGKNWAFPYRGDLYVVNPGTEITIFYRIIYPFPFGNSEKLLQMRVNKKYISPVYSATIVLPDEIKAANDSR